MTARSGLTLPAVVRDGTVETASNIDETWIGTNAVRLFTEAIGRPVSVVNDADAAGVAEVRFGAGRDVAGVVAVITLGTGIGSALIVDGVLVPNTELGHLPLHHGDAEDWAADSVRENEDAVVEEVRAAAPVVPRTGRAPPVALADRHRGRGEQEGEQIPALRGAADTGGPGLPAERSRDRRRCAVRATRRLAMNATWAGPDMGGAAPGPHLLASLLQ